MTTFARLTATLALAVSAVSLSLAQAKDAQAAPQNPPAAAAQAAPAAKAPKLDEPLTGLGFQLKVGHFWNYASKSQNSIFNLSYKGQTIFGKGTEPDPTKIGGDPIDFGDQPLSFKLENGMTSIGGTLLQSLNVTPIQLKNGFGDRFRFIVGLDAQLEKDKQSTSKAGFEYAPKLKPMNVFGKQARSDSETFLAFGMTGEHQSDPTGQSKDIVAAIYRGRLGFGFDFAVNHRRVELLKHYYELVKNLNATQLGQMAKDIDTGGVYQSEYTANMGSLIVDAADKAYPDDNQQHGHSLKDVAAFPKEKLEKTIPYLVGKLQGPLEDIQKAIDNPNSDEAKAYRDRLTPNQPRYAVFAEFEGTYSLTKQVFDRRYRSIWSGNFQYYFDSYRPDNGFITVRYENGFSQAEPDKRTNSLLIEYGRKF